MKLNQVFLVIVLLLLAVVPVGAQDDEELVVVGRYFSIEDGDMAPLAPARRGVEDISRLLWAPLVGYNQNWEIELENGLSESFEISDDGRMYTFTLREAFFSDGTPITAEDVAWNLGHYARQMNPELLGIRENWGHGARYFFDVVGFYEPSELEPSFFASAEVEGVEVIDERTLSVTLETPSSTFVQRTMAGFGVANPADIEAAADMTFADLDWWTSTATSSGPYRIVEAVPGEYFVMEPNEFYWGPEPAIDRIRVVAVSSDMNTVLLAFANGEVDLIQRPFSGDAARQALADPYISERLVALPGWSVNHFWVTPSEPLDDRAVRRAFSMAIDRDVIVDIMNAGLEQPIFRRANFRGSSAVPFCQDATTSVTDLPFDPELARAELETSQYWPDVLGMEVNIYVPNPDALPQSEAVKAMLEANLGMTNIQIRTEQIADLMNPPFDLHLWWNGQSAHAPELIGTVDNTIKLVPDEPWNPDTIRAWVDVPYEPELRTLMEATKAESDADAQCEMLAEVLQMHNDVAFSLVMGSANGFIAVQDWVQGWTPVNGPAGNPVYAPQAVVEAH